MIETLLSLPMMFWFFIGSFFVLVLLVWCGCLFVSALNFYRKAEELAPIMADIEAVSAERDRLKAEVNSLRDVLARAESTIRQAEEAEDWLKGHRDEFEFKKRELENVKADLEAYGTRINECKKDEGSISQKVGELTKTYNETLAKDATLKATMELETKRLGDLKQEYLHLNSDVDKLRKEADSLYSKHTELAAISQSVQEQRKLLDSLIGKYEELYKKHAELQDEIAKESAKRIELASLNQQILETEAALKRVKTDYETLCGKCEEVRETISKGNAAQLKLDILNKQTEEKNEAYQELQKEFEALKNHCFAKKHEAECSVEKKRGELNQLIRQTEAMKIEFSKLQSRVDKLSSTRDNAQKALAAFESEKMKLELLRQEIAAKQAECRRLEQELTDKRAECDRLVGESRQATQTIEYIRAARKEDSDIWSGLDAPIITPSVRECAAVISEIDWLNDVRGKLSDSGYIFQDRTLKAFHTGLKCGDISPLVVLAGISGTGKSLLPELYSMAAGFNFLSVPVQPRWDSPQDLLGFFNYMEGRYKATELARFLWQLDTRNNRKNALDDDSLSIVLLDEMNLARVEYYFSDFLSKLELRRGIKEEDDDKRRNAEIEIECNTNSDVKFNRRLFVDSGTFFVGTMNEDETTQMLSDKVVDRSNIMRFGKPSEFAEQPDKVKFFRSVETEPRITRTVWNTWLQHKETDSYDDFVRKSLIELNDVFASIGRPFGHRTWQAVEKYIAHYPVGEDGDRSPALADQIEMKILPKLNGLELNMDGFDHVRSTVQKVIGELNDDSLKETFERACDPNSNAFFKWRGVMR